MSQVLAIPHGFKTHKRAQFEAPAGTPLHDLFAEALHRTEIQPIHLRHGYVSINGEQIIKDEWPLTVIGEDDEIVIIGGVSGDFGGILLQIAGFALASFVPPLGAFSIAGVNIGQFLVRAGITLLTNLGAQALAPTTSRPNLGGNEPVEARFSITGTRNQAQPYGLVPRVYGTVENYYPPLAAQPYTAVHGADKHAIFMLFCIGEGYVAVDNIKVGDQPLTQLPEVSYQIRYDVTHGSMPTLYPNRVTQENLSIQLKKGTWHQRRSPTDTNEIFVEVSFPGGLGRLSDRNVKFGIVVQFQVQYRSVPSGGWINAPITNAGGARIDGNGRFSILGFYKSALRRAVKFSVTNGQYDVRVVRQTVDDQSITDGENQSNTFENSYWSAVRFHDNQRPIEREGVTLLAVRARATDSLNGVIDQLSCRARGRIQEYNGSTWTNTYTSNPAWIYADILRGLGNYKPIDDSRIDLDQLIIWANQCEAWGVTFDGVFNFDLSVWDALHEAAAVGRASPLINDGTYTVFIDKPETVPVQLITPRNSFSGTGSRILAEQPHALKVRFPNRLTKGQIDEITVYADGYNINTATKIEAIDLAWVTNSTNAYREARVLMAKAELRNEIISRTMTLEHVKFNRGDYVQIQDDIMLVGLHSARVKSISLPDITLDARLPFTMEAEKTYSIRVRHNDGIYEDVVTTDIAATDTLETTTISADDITTGDLIVLGETGSVTFDAIVRSIEPKADLTADCSFLPAAFNLYDAISGPVPDYDPVITLPPPLVKDRPPKPIFTSVKADESALVGSGFSAQSAIAVGIIVEATADRATPESLQVRYRVTDYETEWIFLNLPWYATEAVLTPVEDLANYEIEARTVNQFGLPSDWASTSVYVTGKSNPPPNVERFYRQGDELTWPYPDPPLDFVGFRLRANFGESVNLSTAYQVTAGLISSPPFNIADFNGTQTFLLTAVDSTGNESETPAILTINLGDALTGNLLLKQDEDAGGYTGTKTNATVSGTDLIADISLSAAYWRAPSADAWGAPTDPAWPTTSYEAFSYSFIYAPVTNHVGATIRLDLTTVGDTTIQYRNYTSQAYWGAPGDPAWGAPTDPAWPDSEVGVLTPFPGSLGPIIDTAESYEFVITVNETESGGGRGEISNLDLIVDVPDITEYIEDEPIAATGTVRLPITETYRVIKIVNLTVQDDAGSAVTAKVYDKDATNGPEIRCFNAAGTRVAGNVDATIIGY